MKNRILRNPVGLIDKCHILTTINSHVTSRFFHKGMEYFVIIQYNMVTTAIYFKNYIPSVYRIEWRTTRRGLKIFNTLQRLRRKQKSYTVYMKR